MYQQTEALTGMRTRTHNPVKITFLLAQKQKHGRFYGKMKSVDLCWCGTASKYNVRYARVCMYDITSVLLLIV